MDAYPDRDDLAVLLRFVYTVLWNRPSDDPGWLLFAKRQREKLGLPERSVTPDEIKTAVALDKAIQHGVNPLGKSKLHRKPSRIDLRMIITPDKDGNVNYEPYIIMAALNREITRTKAEEELCKLLNISDAAKYYDRYKVSIQNALNLCKHVHFVVHGTTTGFKVFSEGYEAAMKEKQALEVCNNSSLPNRSSKTMENCNYSA